jgi:hypothetical protein
MVTNNNSNLTKELIEGGRLQITEGVPRLLAQNIQPVLEVNPKLLSRTKVLGLTIARNTSASGINIFVGTGKQAIITGIIFACVQDVTSDNVVSYINITIDGNTNTIVLNRKATTTADKVYVTIQFPIPIKIDLGSNVTFTHTFTAGSSTSDLIVFGYVDDTARA